MGTVLHACRDGCSEDVQSMKVHGFLLELTWGMLIVDTRIYRFVLCCCALHSTGVDIFPVRVLGPYENTAPIKNLGYPRKGLSF